MIPVNVLVHLFQTKLIHLTLALVLHFASNSDSRCNISLLSICSVRVMEEGFFLGSTKWGSICLADLSRPASELP